MKILQVVHGFPPASNAGAEKYTYFLSKELGNEHEVHVLYPSAEGNYLGIKSFDDDYPLVRHEICVTKIAMPPVKAAQAYLQFEHSYLSRQTDTAFYHFIQELQPDIIHFQHLLYLSSGFISTAHMLGIPTVFTLHDYWFSCPTVNLFQYTQLPCDGPQADVCRECWSRSQVQKNALLSQNSTVTALSTSILKFFNTSAQFAKRQEFMINALSQVDRIIAPSQFLRNWFIAAGVCSDKIVHIEYGYNADTLSAKKDKPVGDKLIFGYVGRIVPIKGIHTLVDAFTCLPEGVAELRLYGGYDENDPYVAAQLKKIGARKDIKFMGFTHDVSAAYLEIDILVFPSLWYENCPLTLAECRILEIPVLASNIGAIPEFVEDGINGFLFQPGDPIDLSDKMMSLIDNPKSLEKLAIATRRYPPSIQQHTRIIETIYEKLAHLNSGPPH